jgi:hypothetical protein
MNIHSVDIERKTQLGTIRQAQSDYYTRQQKKVQNRVQIKVIFAHSTHTHLPLGDEVVPVAEVEERSLLGHLSAGQLEGRGEG